jgi:hypothetical protein
MPLPGDWIDVHGKGIPLFVIVADERDALASCVRRELLHRDVRLTVYRPSRLADVPVELTADAFRIGGEDIVGILFRCTSETSLSAGFRDEDRRFGDLEVAATWLAALQLPSVLAINRLDAAAWFEDSWPLWRSRLRAAGVKLARFQVGSGGNGEPYWQPYSGSMRSRPFGVRASTALGAAVLERPAQEAWYVADGNVVSPSPPGAVCDAAAYLHSAGIAFAAVGADADGGITSVDVNPRVSDEQIVAHAGRVLGERIQTHMLRG